jgi:VIT family
MADTAKAKWRQNDPMYDFNDEKSCLTTSSEKDTKYADVSNCDNSLSYETTTYSIQLPFPSGRQKLLSGQQLQQLQPVSQLPQSQSQESQPQQQHLGSSRQYWRDIILGINDGIISTFLLISGVVGSQMSCHEILLTALSGSLAGAVSMCAGTSVCIILSFVYVYFPVSLETAMIIDFNTCTSILMFFSTTTKKIPY